MKSLMVVALLVVLAAPASAAKVQDLAWMAGSWVGDSKAGRAEEHWTTPGGGLMLCMHRDLAEGKNATFEFLRIFQKADKLTLVALPNGQNETPFPLKSLEGKKAVFENLEHDFPQRIIYWQDERGTLKARVEGMINGKLEGEDYSWVRSELR